MEQINGVSYQYQLLRYRHDHVTGEFANIGLIYYDPQSGYLRAGFEDKKYGRLSRFFGDSVQGGFILSTLKQLKKSVDETGASLSSDTNIQFSRIEDLTAFVLPPDDNGLYFSEAWRGRHFDHDIAFNELYERIIAQYQEEGMQRQDDAYAWKKVYQKYFDRYDLTQKLHKHTVRTSADSFDFQHTCKNGAWHCFQSLFFALKHEGSIKDKIYRWNGIAQELLTSGEPLKVYLLSIFPENPHLADLIRTKLNISHGNVEVRVVSEGEAAQLALQLKDALSGPGHDEN